MSEAENKDFSAKMLSAVEAAELLGVKPTRIKQLIRDRMMIGRWADGTWWVPSDALVELDSPLGRQAGAEKIRQRLAPSLEGEAEEEPTLAAATHVPLWLITGTATVLSDAGFTDEQILVWLTTYNTDLEAVPLLLMRDGGHHRVNQIASTLGW